jgi:hypothetical protein
MPDRQNMLRAALKKNGTQNRIWTLGLGLFEEQLNTRCSKKAPIVGKSGPPNSSWDSALLYDTVHHYFKFS